MSTMTVEEVINRLREWPQEFPVTVGMCEPGTDQCSRGDLCRVLRDPDREKTALLHGPLILHFAGDSDAQQLNVRETIARLREFPKHWDARIGIDDNIRDKCRRLDVHQCTRGRAGKDLENVLIHGPLLNHR